MLDLLNTYGEHALLMRNRLCINPTTSLIILVTGPWDELAFGVRIEGVQVFTHLNSWLWNISLKALTYLPSQDVGCFNYNSRKKE